MMKTLQYQNIRSESVITALDVAGCNPIGTIVYGWRAHCPAHDDRNPSLSVSIGDNGTWLVNCFAGCSVEDVVEALGLTMADLFPDGSGSSGPRQRTPKAEPDTCDRAYQAALDVLPLWNGHREDLGRRGLSDAEIDLRRYRSLPGNRPEERPSLTGYRSVTQPDGTRASEGPVDTTGVPGFRDGRLSALFGRSGIMIPVRDAQERIVACKVRLDSGLFEEETGDKYRWLSNGSPSSGSPVHVPLWDGPKDTVRVTEGPLKADVATALTGTLTIGVGGAKAVRSAVPVLRELGAHKVLVAFDADEAGQRANQDLVDALAHSGLDVAVETWPADAGKGIDDVWANGRAGAIMRTPIETASDTTEPPPVIGSVPGNSSPKVSQATELVNIGLRDYRLGQSEQGEPFAVPRRGPCIALLFRGGRGASSLGADLARAFFQQHGKAASATARTDALATLEGFALQEDPTPLALRVAHSEQGLVLDLGGKDGRVVLVTPTGWRILPQSPSDVLFRRTRLTQPLPDPDPDGDVAELRRLLNVPDGDWPLLLGYLLAALFPDIPHAILLLTGPQGSAKSTAAKMVVSVVDPSGAPTRKSPKDEEHWVTAAAASWVVALDNVSNMQGWLADSLCRAVTGEGDVRRALYTDSDVHVTAFRRAVILTAIDLGKLRGDLADRLLPVELEWIGTESRRREKVVLAAFVERWPRILGGLLNLAVRVLAALPTVDLGRLPRMADFAYVLAAMDAVLGTDSLAAYEHSREDLSQTVVEGDLVAAAVRDFAFAYYREHGQQWEGQAGVLRQLLAERNPTLGLPMSRFPQTANRLSGRIKEVEPALRSVGVTVRRKRIKGAKVIVLAVTDPKLALTA